MRAVNTYTVHMALVGAVAVLCASSVGAREETEEVLLQRAISAVEQSMTEAGSFWPPAEREAYARAAVDELQKFSRKMRDSN